MDLFHRAKHLDTTKQTNTKTGRSALGNCRPTNSLTFSTREVQCAQQLQERAKPCSTARCTYTEHRGVVGSLAKGGEEPRTRAAFAPAPAVVAEQLKKPVKRLTRLLQRTRDQKRKIILPSLVFNIQYGT